VRAPEALDGSSGNVVPDDTAYVELDVVSALAAATNAADDVPTDDPASQALELAATRAEVKRLARAEEALQRAVRLRDGWLQAAREEIKRAADEHAKLEAQLREAQQRQCELEELIEELRLELNALRAAEPSSGEYTVITDFDPEQPPRLEAVNHDGPSLTLDRKVITVGRTAASDLCVPSPLVSRDHARLLVGSNTVTLVDVGSVNGSYVNHRQVKKQVLRAGDLVCFADRAYRLIV
jgi:malate synthase